MMQRKTLMMTTITSTMSMQLGQHWICAQQRRPMQRMLMNLGAQPSSDTDGDGVNDFIDACEGTPSGLTVNQWDAQTSMVTVCLPTLTFVLTVLHDGQSMLMVVPCQKPVQWTAGTSVNGPMDIVPTFTVPTLDGTFTFQNKWTGNDVYLFMFKYTDGSGTRIQQLGRQIREHLSVICLTTLTCSTVPLIQVITTMFSRERAMLKHDSTQVKKNSGMAVFITSTWMQATFRAA